MRIRKLGAVALASPALALAVIASTGTFSATVAQAASTTFKADTPAPKPLKKMVTITIGEPTAVENFATIPVGIAMGEFTKENLHVTLIKDPGGTNAEPQELAQGDVQAVETGINASALNAINSGIPLVYTGCPDFPNPATKAGFWVNKQFVTSDGLFNKAKAATFKMSLGTGGVSSSGAAEVQAWLEKSHESLGNFTQLTLAPATLVTSLKNGGIGGGFVNAPFWTTLVGNPTLVDVASPPYATGVIEMYKPWVKQNKAVAQALMRAMIRTDRTYLQAGYRTNAQVMNIISGYLGIPVATIDKSTPILFSMDFSMTGKPAGAAKTQLPTKTVLLVNQKGWIQAGGVLQYTKPVAFGKLTTSALQMAAAKG
jgi:NitT/TauT family transport system substrate-binding protein